MENSSLAFETAGGSGGGAATSAFREATEAEQLTPKRRAAERAGRIQFFPFAGAGNGSMGKG
jgi:hypothetical protein